MGSQEVAPAEYLYGYAVLVDYLDCVTVSEALTKDLMPKLVDAEGEYVGGIGELDKSLFVAITLRKSVEFRAITRYCIKYGQPSDSNGFAVLEFSGKDKAIQAKSVKVDLTTGGQVVSMYP